METKIEKPLTENVRQKANACYRLLKNMQGYLTKEEIGNLIGVSNERAVRDIISLVATKKPIISKSNSKGYKLAKTKEDVREVINVWHEIDSRIEELKKRREPLIKFVEENTNIMVYPDL